MNYEAKAFIAIDESFADYETVNHSNREYVRDAIHVIQPKVSICGSAKPSRAYFTTSVHSTPT
ncbi:hypothetical protein QV13_04110 [Mesorhizobium hungaricum]|jgi:hypothetical protein|uniref:Uncharacterized protein n=1 Tax=Mesorhizobium hungaricum TaxID=1566387 RepID=A0A1C2E8V2_9HYPH|nr:hypothetical protein [Mesorhizobium sp.]MDQ0329184.1 hypothetical protein [Mesorhizobium sp. YL-MeA3-2017]OCX23399.1 hypothetical protein QV13_04110 [Mesorhizobium hungaricum]